MDNRVKATKLTVKLCRDYDQKPAPAPHAENGDRLHRDLDTGVQRPNSIASASHASYRTRRAVAGPSNDKHALKERDRRRQETDAFRRLEAAIRNAACLEPLTANNRTDSGPNHSKLSILEGTEQEMKVLRSILDELVDAFRDFEIHFEGVCELPHAQVSDTQQPHQIEDLVLLIKNFCVQVRSILQASNLPYRTPSGSAEDSLNMDGDFVMVERASDGP